MAALAVEPSGPPTKFPQLRLRAYFYFNSLYLPCCAAAQAVLLPLRFPGLFTGLRGGPRNVLLFGAPGAAPCSTLSPKIPMQYPE